MIGDKKIVVVVPHSHSWFWTQTCVASLYRHWPYASGYDVRVVVVNNSPWSPAIKGITDTDLGRKVEILQNHKSNRFHASALDCVVEMYDFDLMMALETDVIATKDGWLQWFVDQLWYTDYAVGMWHHEQFVNPSCTLYRGNVLRDMLEWSKPNGLYRIAAPQDELRWGPEFSKSGPLDHNLHNAENPAEVLRDMKSWIAGPFAEKRGWPAGTRLKEPPSGQLKGPGWYEPGQQLHHWAVERGHTYAVCPHLTTKRLDGVPLQSVYGGWGKPEMLTTYPESGRLSRLEEQGYDHQRQLEARELFGNGYTTHLWGGTRALDILKHPVTCQFVKANTPIWLAREARFWLEVVPQAVRQQTLDLIRQYGWHTTGQGTPDVTDRDREAADYVRQCYAAGCVVW